MKKYKEWGKRSNDHCEDWFENRDPITTTINKETDVNPIELLVNCIENNEETYGSLTKLLEVLQCNGFEQLCEEMKKY